MKAKTKSFFGAALLLTALLMPSHLPAQYIDGFIILPPRPTVTDTVRLIVCGSLSSTGIHVVDSSLFRFGNGFEVMIHTFVDSGFHLPILLPYRRSFMLGKLPAGNYSVHAQSFWNYGPFDAADTSFVVEDPLRVEENLEEMSKPSTTSLKQNYPNPFNPSTMMIYHLPHASEVELSVFDLLGKRVRTLVQDRQQPGQYRVLWNGHDDHGVAVPSGVYLYRLQTGNFMQARKMIFVH